MAKKKTTPARKKQPASLKTHLLKTLLGALILLALVLAAGMALLTFVPPHQEAARISPEKASQQRPVFEIYPEKALKPPPPPERKRQPGAKPQVAIIIDDLGYDLQIAEKFLACPVPLTLSILPHSRYTRQIAETAHRQGAEVMLHLPMEPLEYPRVNPGPGVLLTTMSPNALIRQLEHNLAQVPYVKGVNNHMGSKMTGISTRMYQIFSVLKKHHLFFIDSRTTNATLCRPSARLLQVAFSERDVFLDNRLDNRYIAHQLELLIQTARRQGHAIGIGHPHRATYRVLKQRLPAFKNEIEFVPASRLVHVSGA